MLQIVISPEILPAAMILAVVTLHWLGVAAGLWGIEALDRLVGRSVPRDEPHPMAGAEGGPSILFRATGLLPWLFRRLPRVRPLPLMVPLSVVALAFAMTWLVVGALVPAAGARWVLRLAGGPVIGLLALAGLVGLLRRAYDRVRPPRPPAFPLGRTGRVLSVQLVSGQRGRVVVDDLDGRPVELDVVAEQGSLFRRDEPARIDRHDPVRNAYVIRRSAP